MRMGSQVVGFERQAGLPGGIPLAVWELIPAPRLLTTLGGRRAASRAASNGLGDAYGSGRTSRMPGVHRGGQSVPRGRLGEDIEQKPAGRSQVHDDPNDVAQSGNERT